MWLYRKKFSLLINLKRFAEEKKKEEEGEEEEVEEEKVEKEEVEETYSQKSGKEVEENGSQELRR